jgi:hypothetical protein
VLIALVTAKFTSIVLAAAIMAISRALWAVLWIIPPLLRPLSVAFTLNSEPLAANAPESAQNTADIEGGAVHHDRSCLAAAQCRQKRMAYRRG